VRDRITSFLSKESTPLITVCLLLLLLLFVSLLLPLQKYKVDPEHVHCVFLAASPVGTLMPLTDEQIEAPAEFGTVSTCTF
jgi:hypothetical protein